MRYLSTGPFPEISHCYHDPDRKPDPDQSIFDSDFFIKVRFEIFHRDLDPAQKTDQDQSNPA
jgi:hypothetical protein